MFLRIKYVIILHILGDIMEIREIEEKVNLLKTKVSEFWRLL